jgi:hypothetical protein
VAERYNLARHVAQAYCSLANRRGVLSDVIGRRPVVVSFAWETLAERSAISFSDFSNMHDQCGG